MSLMPVVVGEVEDAMEAEIGGQKAEGDVRDEEDEDEIQMQSHYQHLRHSR
jgi:hypothetical protein